MKKYRIGIFESNSSSSHSLSLGKPADKEVINEKKEILLGNEIYGWGYQELTTWYEKANYFSVECINDARKKEKLIKVLKSRYPNYKIKFGTEGVIDHQSKGDIWDKVTNVEDLYNVIFGDSVIVISNDNM